VRTFTCDKQSSKMDPPLDKANRISDSDSVSVITVYKGEKVAVQQQFQHRKKSENM